MPRVSRRVLVIGGGVVGLACAHRLATLGDDVVLVERHRALGTETSSRNSEVVHAGIYYPKDSAKTRLCIAGRRLLLAFCEAENIAFSLTGKLIVAADTDELDALDAVYERAGLAGPDVPLVRVSAAEIAVRAPGVRAVAGLWSAGTGIVDGHAFMQRLAHRAADHGALVLLDHEVVGASWAGDGWRIELRNPAGERETHSFAAVVNAAGHRATAVAQLAGHGAPAQIAVKGSYFALGGPPPAATLVYPVPRPHLVGLGTHLTVDLSGRARLGPDVEIGADPADHRVDPRRRGAFATAARRLLPDLRDDDLRPDYAGFRPKLAVDRFADFHIAGRGTHGAKGWVDLCGIESPGLTASMAIAVRVGELLAA